MTETTLTKTVVCAGGEAEFGLPPCGNCGVAIEVPLNAEEIAQREADIAEYAARKSEENAIATAKAAAKEAAHEKLAALGLTAEEIAALQ